MSFTSLRNKSHYSCGTAVGTSKQYIQGAKEKGLTSFALTDHCTLGGALNFYKEGKKQNFPIAIGVEFNINYGAGIGTDPIALICFNHEGYTNLCRLITIANSNNKVISAHDLQEINQGLYCFTRDVGDRTHLEPIFGDKLFFEILPYESNHIGNLNIIETVDPERIVVSSDAHMIHREDKILQDIMYQNSSYGKQEELYDHSRYMMGVQEQLTRFVQLGYQDHQNAIVSGIKNANRIIEECGQLELKFKDQLVNYPHKLHELNDGSLDKEGLLRKIIEVNARWDLNDPVYKERLEYEIDTIVRNNRLDLTDYFLVVEDFCRFCRKNDIPVGPGRGSGAGSLVAYGLMITHLDPLEYGLLFERFISKGRIEAGTLPDFDIDFADPVLVKDYLIDLYGEDRVMPIGTYQSLATRGAMKDAFRILYPDVHFQVVNAINGSIDNDLREEGDSEAEFFEKQMTMNPAFAQQMNQYPKVKEVVGKLVGFYRQQGVHPCGMAITQDPIKEFAPTRDGKGRAVLEYSGDDCEYAGIIKFDTLGLKTLKFFASCLRNIKNFYENSEECCDMDYPETIYDIPLNDERTHKQFEKGKTESVFQFNSDVAKSILTALKIESLDDLSMVTSVGRPGPMQNGQHNSFIKRRNSGDATPPHPALKELLENTYGIMIYQESVMKCAELMGGYSLAQTDDIRKAMGKKKLEVLLPYKEGFIEYCQKNFPDTAFKGEEGKVSRAEEIWNLMETFSGYGFNKSHSISYALIGYYCQYLKTHYPLEWWCACLQNEDKKESIKKYYAAYENRICLPSILHSKAEYYVDYFKEYTTDEVGDEVEGMVVMPFHCIQNVGTKAAKIIEDSGPFEDFADFYNKITNRRIVDKRVVTNMIFAGVFDCWETDKETLIKQYYELRKDKNIPPELLNLTRDFEMEKKYDVMPFLTLDYIQVYQDILCQCKYPDQIVDYIGKGNVKIVGKIDKLFKRKIKRGDNKGKIFYGAQLSNNNATYDVTIWPDQVGIYREKIVEGLVVVMEGSVNNDWNEKVQFVAKSIHTIKEVRRLGGLL